MAETVRQPDPFKAPILTRLLAASPLLGAVPEGSRDFLATHMEAVSLEAGAFVFFQSDPGDAFYLVEEGRLQVYRTSPDGRDRTLAYLGAGDVLGEMALLDGLPRSATVLAVERTRLWRLRRQAFLSLLRSDPDLALSLIRLLARRLREANQKLEESAAGPVPERLLQALRRLAAQPKPSAGTTTTPLRLRLTQDELASMVGTTRESVNRALARLEARGVVVGRRRGTLLVDHRLLVQSATEDE